jgi:hypothetical protein
MHLSRNLLIAASLCQLAVASLPTSIKPSQYDRLVTDSPFTTKLRAVSPPHVDVFADYVLAGVTPLDGSYLVSLFNRKKPEERISIPANALGFKLIEVRSGNDGPLSTSVVISHGNETGVVGFDEKLLVLKSSANTKPQPAHPNAQISGGNHPPRPRVLPATH